MNPEPNTLREVSVEEVRASARPRIDRLAEEAHPSATHVDSWGMPTRFVVEDVVRDGRQSTTEWSFYPTPCCGASAKAGEYGLFCRVCYAPVPMSFGGVPTEPFRLIRDDER